MQAVDFRPDCPGQLVPTVAGVKAFVPDRCLRRLDLDANTIMTYGQAEGALGDLRGCTRRLVNPHYLGVPLLRREAILSSRIEGTITTPEQLVLLEAAAGSGIPAAKTSDSETREVLNYVTAMHRGLGLLGELPICLRLLREVHATLMEGVRGGRDRLGEFRDTQNWIGRKGDPIQLARFVPPPIAEMNTALADFEEYLNTDLDMPLLVKLALAHYQFETIHPFRDGNGRIGRLLIPLLLCKHRALPEPLLYLSSFFERHYDAYTGLLLRVSQTGDWLSWVRFFLEAVRECASDAAGRAEQLIALRAKWHAQFQSARSSALLMKLIDRLFQAPGISIKQAQECLGVTYTAAWWSIRKLVEANVLIQVPGMKKNQLFFAPDIIRLIDQAEATQPAADEQSA